MVKAENLLSVNIEASNRARHTESLFVLLLLALTTGVYAILFNRANVLSHSIGYNLYASERVLEGAVPYRDFHTLYPPAIFYLNALLFKWFGISLHSALPWSDGIQGSHCPRNLLERSGGHAESVGDSCGVPVATVAKTKWPF
jgi:hypothetical protein